MSGIGNIYADEALWRARLHYARPTETLTRAEAARVLGAAREVMSEALAAGGTSFDALYVNVNGESGYFDRSLDAYGQAGEPCARCGTPIRRDAVHEPVVVQLPSLPAEAASCPSLIRRSALARGAAASARWAARSAATAAGTLPSASMGVHASVRRHCVPQPEQANRPGERRDAVQLHVARHGLERRAVT